MSMHVLILVISLKLVKVDLSAYISQTHYQLNKFCVNNYLHLYLFLLHDFSFLDEVLLIHGAFSHHLYHNVDL